MWKLSTRKPILCELLCLNFKRKNNIKRKRLWVWQISTERHSEGEFHVLVKALKLFQHEFFFKHIATWHFHFSQWCFTVFVWFNNYLHSAVSLADNTIQQFIPLWNWILFNSKTEKKTSSTRKINYCAFSWCTCAKLKISLSAEKFLKWSLWFVKKKASFRTNKFVINY